MASALSEKIENQSETDQKAGRRNHLTDCICIIGAIVLSNAAAIFAALGLNSVLTAITTSLSGIIITVQTTMNFRGRAAWYFLKSAKLDSISLALDYEGLTEPLAAKQFRETEVEMEKDWAKFVQGGRAGAKKG